MQIRRTAAALTSAAALSITGIAMATPAQAEPIVTGGLVNITLVDVLSGNEVAVTVPIGVAANICDVNVAVLADQLDTGDVTCEGTVEQDVPISFQ